MAQVRQQRYGAGVLGLACQCSLTVPNYERLRKLIYCLLVFRGTALHYNFDCISQLIKLVVLMFSTFHSILPTLKQLPTLIYFSKLMDVISHQLFPIIAYKTII